MAEVVFPKSQPANGGVKRDYRGNQKLVEAPRNAYTSMFEGFRDELDKHHDRRMRIQNVSRDVTGLAKKMIFTLQRVRTLAKPLQPRIQAEIEQRYIEIGTLLKTIEDDVKGMNRHRYNLMCLEELVEAVTFMHYLTTQTLMSPEQTQDAIPADVALTASDYVYGVFDLTGEMMRSATSNTALNGAIPAGPSGRTIQADLQDVSSMLQVNHPIGRPFSYSKKMDVMVEQVRKVERLGYGVRIRGNERPKGWMPDLNEDRGDEGGGGGQDD
ncbi:Translin [Microdochium bolleyi]|uniref:Translin n=1 Tax=Microdochium bolleyi TaxID=196109 RepID=A0A136J2I7_9PEZI|nr:Translin [Microdochium bolleyi]